MGLQLVDAVRFQSKIVDSIRFGEYQPFNMSIVTTGLIPLIVNSQKTFELQGILNGLPWTALQGGTGNLILKDPNGSQTTIVLTMTGPAPTANWTVTNVLGQWTRAWDVTDSSGLRQVSEPIAFQVAVAP